MAALAAGLALALAVVLVAPRAWAWHEWNEARSALARYQPEAARGHLAYYLRVWPNSADAHLLASRAARQSGDLEAADRHLRACQRLSPGDAASTALEWALLQAASGNLGEVEEFLQQEAERSPEAAPLVWEAVAEGYIRVYRIFDALACLEHWLEIDPDNLRALELRGQAYYSGKAASRGSENFRRVIELDPTRDATRWRLILCLLDVGGYEEALTHLEYFERRKPDAEVQVRLARCHNMLGRPEQARQILDAVLQAEPDHGLALRTRGQFALADSQPDLAEGWLRRAVLAMPNDYQSHWLLVQSLQLQSKADEASAQMRVADQVKERAERLGELQSRKLSVQPLNPALHYEMGVLLLRSGHKEVGESWLLSAVSLDPDYRQAHAALADHYESQGDSKRAEEHRRRAQAPR